MYDASTRIHLSQAEPLGGLFVEIVKMEMYTDEPVDKPNEANAAIADVIAKIAALPPEDRGLIVGIFGPWGLGKTSLLQLILHTAENAGIPKRHLINFSAWRIHPDELSHDFLSELANGLGLVANTATIDSIREYAELLSGAGKFAEKILAVSSRMVNILGLMGIGSIAFIESHFIKVLVLAGAIALYATGPTLFGTA